MMPGRGASGPGKLAIAGFGLQKTEDRNQVSHLDPAAGGSRSGFCLPGLRIIQYLQDMTRICRKSEGLSAEWARFFPQGHLLAGLQPTRCRLDRKQRCCLALVELAGLEIPNPAEQPPRPLSRLLSAGELEQLAAFRLDKRRREWLGGRLAGKQAVLLLTDPGNEACTISILPDEHGRPCLGTPLPPPVPSLSISHSGAFAVAMASRSKSCGIDIQEIVPRIDRLADRIGEPPELALLAERLSDDTTTCLTMLWAAKEAVKKSLLSDQSAFFNAIRLREIHRDRTGTLRFHLSCSRQGKRQATARVPVHRFAGYILAFTEQDHA